MEPRVGQTAAIQVIDFEGSPRSGVVEFGVVTLCGGQIHSTATRLCRPHGRILAEESSVHGLTGPCLEGWDPFASYFSLFVDLRRTGVLAAHNRHAEEAFLRRTWPIPPPVPDWQGWPSAGLLPSINAWGPWIDTLAIYRHCYPGLDDYGLMALVRQFNCQQQLEAAAKRYCPPRRCRPHCALFDALACACLLLRLQTEPALAGSLDIAGLLVASQSIPAQTELF